MGGRALPAHCSLAVVGAGWGGVYAAWRLAVDTPSVDARRICLFEANGRVGGRVFSVRGLPHFGELAIDVGGYRFQESQRLPADLVWTALEMPTACYDFECAAQCEGPQNCYVMRDSYGNNAGYASVIERMLSEVEERGASVFFGATLVSVTPPGGDQERGEAADRESGMAARTLHAMPPSRGNASVLRFAEWSTGVLADRVILNLPANALERLDKRSVIFENVPRATASAMRNVSMLAMVKSYVWYDDAWWASKLGLMQGEFLSNGSSSPEAPLMGRYHDGPLKCAIGVDSAGQPVYSGDKVRMGNCSGALEVFYGPADKFYVKLMTSPLEPLTVMTAEDTNPTSTSAIGEVHRALIRHHDGALRRAGIDPQSIAPPKALVVANWVADGAFTPGIGSFGSPPHRHGTPIVPDPPGTDALRAAVRKPSAYEVYIVNQDYGYQSGWATGSLIMAEKVLQSLGLGRPTWLNASWYATHVAVHP